MKADHPLLFIGKEGEEENIITEGLENLGWCITRTSEINNVKKILRLTHQNVGVISLNESYLKKASLFENIINEISIKLIAVTSREMLHELRNHQGLARLFFGYHVFPIEIDGLHHALQNLLSIMEFEKTLHEASSHHEQGDCQMVGNSPSVRALCRAIHKVAIVDAPVLIQGESGTGKELTAKAIHRESSRAVAPFNAINCGALPNNLIQSELFGHERGAFTGATQKKIGIIENTDGGTLFLDEIGDLPLEMQVNLLRFLENRTVQRVGGLQEIEVDLRVLAATHIDLEKAVEEGRFREDLYHRLNVLQVKVPALRERGEDIAMLAHHFFKKFAGEKPLIVKGFNKESLSVMQLYKWPGNIRELINRVRRAMVMSEHPLIRPSDLGLERRHTESRYAASLEEARDLAERSVVMASLSRNSFNVQNASRELGISRVTLYRLMEKHHIYRSGNRMTSKQENGDSPTSPGNVLTFNGPSKERLKP